MRPSADWLLLSLVSVPRLLALLLFVVWFLLSADVAIIGAGPAGVQCAEHLTRHSPIQLTDRVEPRGPSASMASAASSAPSSSAACAAASAASSSLPLDVLLLEGRDRIGGRIDTVPVVADGQRMYVERGAAFQHGADIDGQVYRKGERKRETEAI